MTDREFLEASVDALERLMLGHPGLAKPTDEPILGLGEDYEPEIVWNGWFLPSNPHYGRCAMNTGVSTVFPSEKDALEYAAMKGQTPDYTTCDPVTETIAWCRQNNVHTLHLKTGDGTILKTWKT